VTMSTTVLRSTFVVTVGRCDRCIDLVLYFIVTLTLIAEFFVDSF